MPKGDRAVLRTHLPGNGLCLSSLSLLAPGQGREAVYSYASSALLLLFLPLQFFLLHLPTQLQQSGIKHLYIQHKTHILVPGFCPFPEQIASHAFTE